MKYIILFLIGFNLYSKVIVGTIYDSYTKEAVPNVSIIMNYEKQEISTDSLGRFELIVDTAARKTHVDFIKQGYAEKHLNFSNELDSLNIFLVPLTFDYADITVTDQHIQQRHYQLVSESKVNDDLTKSMSDLIHKSYGVSSVEMGEAVSRPVINGLSGNRLTIVNNNFKSKDLSANSVDHSQAYTLNNTKNISILYGPDLIRYGSSLAGKTIKTTTNLTISNKIEENTSLLTTSIASVNEKFSIATKNELNYLLDGVAINAIYTKANDIRTPQSRLANTYYQLYEFSAATYYEVGEFHINPYGSIFNKEYGIPGGFVGAHPNGVDIRMKRNTVGVNSELHLHGSLFDKLILQYERNFYDHREFENSGLIGAQFRFVSNTARLELEQHQGSLFKNGYFGITAARKDNQLGGFVFIPNNNYNIFSAYLNEELSLHEHLIAKAGLRFETTKIRLDEIYTNNNQQYKDLNFNALSGSFLIDYRINDRFDLLATVSHSNRSPEPEELFSDGPHLASYSYEIGNPNLELEKSISYSFNAIYESISSRISTELYYYDYSNYITPMANGDTNYSTLLPIFIQTNMPAEIYGLNISASHEFSDNFQANINATYTIGKESKSQRNLPLIPPLSLNIQLEYIAQDWLFNLSLDMASSQERTGEFETRTDGYVVLNAFVKRNLEIAGNLLGITLAANNITNTTYRNHLSRIKSVYPQPAIGTELTLSYYF